MRKLLPVLSRQAPTGTHIPNECRMLERPIQKHVVEEFPKKRVLSRVLCAVGDPLQDALKRIVGEAVLLQELVQCRPAGGGFLLAWGRRQLWLSEERGAGLWWRRWRL